MMSIRLRIFPYASLVLVLIAAISPAYSQSTEQELAEMRLAFQQLNYAAAKKAGERALLDWHKLTPQTALEVHQVLGIIAYTEGNFFEAKAQFEHALSLDSNLQLDSLYVSPKIHQFLREVKTNLAPTNGANHAAMRYLVVRDPRPHAAMRSLVLPGLGQIEKGQMKRGRIMMAAAAAGLLATGALHVKRQAARENYLSATTIPKATSAYDRYNTFNRGRNAAVVFTTAVWVYSFFDALIAIPEPPAAKLGVSLLTDDSLPIVAVGVNVPF